MSAIKRVYTSGECRELDRVAIEEHGIPGIELMNRAGRFALDQLQSRFPHARSLIVYAGSGNNAGDGYVVAQLARQRGLNVRVVQVGDASRLQGDAKLAWDSMRAEGIEPHSDLSGKSDVVVDALLGTGATGTVRESYVRAIQEINQLGHKVLALDIPSGIDASTGGRMTDQPVRADLTTTFVGAKIGLFTGAGVECSGDVELSDLNIPGGVFDENLGIELLDPRTSEGLLPRRKISAHKNELGHVLVVGGDLGCGGAAILTAEAAIRSGVGLVSAITRREHVGGFLSRCPEVMVQGVWGHDDFSELVGRADVVAIGPGMQSTSWSRSVLDHVLKCNPSRLVVDAGALRLLGSRKFPSPQNTIVTPHPGEASDLLGISTVEVQQDRPKAIRDLTSRLGCVGVLKGAGSLIAEDGSLKGLVRYANPALATAGSGDVLTGIVAAAYALKRDPVDAARIGTMMHCRAATDASSEASGRSNVAGDFIQNIRPWG